MTWGWQGFADRGFEFPENGEQVGVSPPGRARLRFNTGANQLELSVNANPYTAIGGGGGSSGSGVVTVAATPYTVQSSDDMVLVPAAGIGSSVAVAIPLAADFPGREITIKNLAMGGFLTSLTLSGGDTIDTGAFVGVLVGDFTAITLKSDGGTGWFIKSGF